MTNQRILIVDDQRLYLDGLKALLDTIDGYSVI